MSYKYVIANLQEAKGTWPVIAESTGIPLRTLEKIFSGAIASPSVHTIEKLEYYFLNNRKKK